jgi:hypothetical protein
MLYQPHIVHILCQASYILSVCYSQFTFCAESLTESTAPLNAQIINLKLDSMLINVARNQKAQNYSYPLYYFFLHSRAATFFQHMTLDVSSIMYYTYPMSSKLHIICKLFTIHFFMQKVSLKV